ncbi:urease subunit alpha [Sulfurisphaera tokodaii]|uniref:Urease subunit alpha n=2 Tax=Sulfurisphaera tokodaii TaxID=111955 RepID=URE1_SULTO|nr:urease subunit alpha [Sulfurisphaera tokodaii]Q972W0.2 RecName: Full=Urease subunit alpha; AltName: Full=Urea amidohydrolase subunit alpha [Sulfurisphaera tokodaii str. 7]HII74017.1 urease subunit alpha [Sulfurisphaera tokodaii]
MRISRERYFELYGPTEGDKIRLGDTNLYITIEKDLIAKGDELVFGAGKTARDGLGLLPNVREEEVMDLIITNVVILDPLLGVIKADIGIKDGLIVGIGHGGNPFTMDGVNFVLGSSTEIISGEGLIATPGFIDTHIHWVAPQQVFDALSAGFTTLIGGGTGPAEGTKATTVTPGSWNIKIIAESLDYFPLNFALTAKGSSSRITMEEVLRNGASGFKIHEDWGAMPRVIDETLTVADEYDVQVTIHTDTSNESGYLEDTLNAINGRTIHAYHVEGAGGGHAPDIIKICAEPNVLPSSTNPTKPYTIHTYEEHLEMLMAVHHLNPKVPEDVAYAESRIREETMMAEDYLHDLGAISMMSSDSQAMGRVGETGIRTFQLAHKMKDLGLIQINDNERVLRYLAKITINPAITHGISDYVGTLAPGHIADIVLWDPRFFPVKPYMVIKGGAITWALMGDTNASIAYAQPVLYKPMFGYYSAKSVSFFFSATDGVENLSKIVRRRVLPVKNTRHLTKKDMKYNDILPKIEVNPDTYEVKINGIVPKVPPSKSLPLTQLYFIY